MKEKILSVGANDQVNPDAADGVECDKRRSPAARVERFVRPLMRLEDMTSLKDWHPGNLDLTDPLVVFHSKKIVGSEWMPGGITLYFSDGTKGVIEMMMSRDKFEVEHGKMITNGELYLTGSVSNA